MSGRTRPKKIVAIDWDAHTLRVVHALLTKRGLKIDKLLSVVIPPHLDTANPDEMGRHIRRTLDQEGITTSHAIVDIPRDQAILKTLRLPITQPNELPNMVQVQIGKELPFPVTEAVVDYAVAPAAADQVTGDVLVAAIRCELLELYEATFATARLRLDRIGLRPYANKVAMGELLKHAMPERVLFIDVRPTFMEIDVLRNGALSFSRSASVNIPIIRDDSSILSITGSPTSTGSEAPVSVRESTKKMPGTDDVISALMIEVTRSIEAYRANDPGARVDHVVVGGDVGVEEALATEIEKRLSITSELYNPASTFGWEPDEGAGASAFAALLGLVLGHADDGTLHFDFLHPKKTVSVAKRRLKKAPMAAAIVVLFVAAAGVGLAGITREDRRKLARLNENIQKLQATRKPYRKFLDVVDEINRFDTRQFVWVDVLYNVFSALPTNQELVINHLEMNQKDGRLTLKTKAAKRNTAITIIHNLEDFHREGWEGPRFKVAMGPQTEKKGEKYPYFQDLRITILADKPLTRRSAKRLGRR